MEVAMNRFVSFLAGSMMGAAIGASLALLFTPYSGDELLEMAREAAYTRREQMEARLRDLRSARRASAPDEEV
jgi:gas vesicle protein